MSVFNDKWEFPNDIGLAENAAGRHDIDHYSGCMVGTAIGGAFGAPIEFMKLRKITNRYGPDGLTELIDDKKRGMIALTNDT